MSEEIKVGDRVIWESQSQGSWKRKEGIVLEIHKKRLKVNVDTIVGYDYDSRTEVGEKKHLRKGKIYTPIRRFCRKA